MPTIDPRSCLKNFFQTGRNLGKRPPSLSLRNAQRDARAATTSLTNIGDRVEGAIGAAGRGEFLPGQLLSIGNEFRCPPTPYAHYFSQFAQPKFKFMFFVSLELNSDFVTAFGEQWGDGGLWWFIKQSGRPNVSYEYEETNRYNFRQKALRRATFEPVQIQMYDDLKDVSHSFWNTFMRLQNPVTNLRLDANLLEENGMTWTRNPANQNMSIIRSKDGEQSSTPPQIENPDHQDLFSKSAEEIEGMSSEELQAFRAANAEPRFIETGEPPPINVLQNSSSTGVLPGQLEQKQLIKELNVFHIIDWGRKVVQYKYVNPRINEIRMDELTWESSDPNLIDVTFEYDTFQILFPVAFGEDTAKDWIPPIHQISFNSDDVPVKNLVSNVTGFEPSDIPGF